MNKRPLLSIVIPTKDRYFYLKKLIVLIDSFQSTEIELVLQDNTFDNTEIIEFLQQKDYSYIQYAHKSEQIPVSLNSDLAILNSTGEFVCFIGDDDGVTSYIIDCAHWMKQHNIDVVVPAQISYSWPDFISKNGLSYSGKLIHQPLDGKIIPIDPIQALSDIMAKGFINRGHLPLVYHGIVKRSILDKIYEIGGTYFPAPSPDIANGVALSLIVDKYFNMNIPIIISGASKTHGGGIRKLKNHVANIEDVPFLPKAAKQNWESNIPKVWTGETIWPESAIKALRYMGREDLITNINFEYLYLHFIVYHFSLRSLAYKLSKKPIKLGFFVIFMIGKRYFNAFFRLIYLKIFRKISGKIVFSNVEDINKAVELLQKNTYYFYDL